MNPSETHRGPSQRQLRVGELVRHALADLFNRGGVAEPVLEAGVTVLEVAMTPDLKIANAYVTPFAGERRDDLVAALYKHKKFIRGQISKQLTLKYMPDLRFHLDTTLDYAGQIENLLGDPKVRRDLEQDGS